jgi:pilus assembly protein CpaB
VNMKWSLLAVISLGLVAALCMAGIVILLPTYLHGPVVKKSTGQEVQIMVAAKTLPAMSIVDATAVKTKTIPKSAAPEKYASDGSQVVGKVLVIPMVEGQPFTSGCFVSEGSGAHLASALGNGMRAFGILLGEDAALTGLLYPGGIVDVLVAQKASSDKSDPTARLLLQAVQVLSVEDRSIVSGDEAGAGVTSKLDRARKRLVTLMVDGEQAKLLHSATQCGTVTLAMRNPLDTSRAVTLPPVIRKVAAPAQATAAPWELTILRAGQAETRKFVAASSN